METQALAVCTFKDGALRASINGEIDHHTVREVREEIDAALYLYQPKKLIIDLSSVRFMDSSGLGLIVGRMTNASELGATAEVVGASPRTQKILDMAGLSISKKQEGTGKR